MKLLNYNLKLFYSYSHADEQFRARMEKSLSQLKSNTKLETWYDRKIIVGEKWSKKIRQQIESSDIIAFLVTADFLDSPACVEEWNIAKDLAEKSNTRLVSVIVKDCAWKDFDEMSDYQVIPTDGKAITKWSDEDSAWMCVYEELKKLVVDIQNTFTPNPSFREALSEIEFCSQTKERTSLDDVFVFPQLQTYLRFSDKQKQLNSAAELFEYKKAIVCGELQSGKSKLLCHLYLSIADSARAALLVDLNDIRSKAPSLDVLSKQYSEQFGGDFESWLAQSDKTILFDNLTNSARALEHVKFAEQYFDHVVLATSTDNYYAYFRDEIQLSDYTMIKIEPFSHSKQEQLIRKWLDLSSTTDVSSSEAELTRIDRIERDINSVIISNRVVPRYPFFILSILQTHELFMPSDLQITAYGHCYYALILAHIIKSGIERTDENINTCFNFASHLALFMHNRSSDSPSISQKDYAEFISNYREDFIIRDHLLNRLCGEHGVLKRTVDGGICFNLPYSYYFFLGRQLANSYKENEAVLSDMLEKSYVRENTLSLTFAIHHAQDTSILDDILIHTVYAVDDFKPAKLDEHETRIFHELLSTIPKRILSDRSIEEERESERNKRDIVEHEKEDEQIEGTSDAENQVYILQKNIEILSQILKNKSGILRKEKIEEIVQTICDAGLRLISIFLCSEDELVELTNYIEKRYDKLIGFKKSDSDSKNLQGLTKAVRFTIFVWTMNNIEKIVSALAKPELREIVKKVRNENETPAFDIIYYFYSLDVSDHFDEHQKDELDHLVSKYDSKDLVFLQRILSLRTQHYLNTHKVKGPIKQSVQSILKLENKPQIEGKRIDGNKKN